MKLKYRILSCLTLLAVVWGIVFSGTIFFQQQQDVNFKKLAHSNLLKNHNNSIDNNLLLINLLSNKTEESRESTEYENEANEEDFHHIVLDQYHVDFKLFNLYFFYNLIQKNFTPKCSLIVKYCSLKIPF